MHMYLLIFPKDLNPLGKHLCSIDFRCTYGYIHAIIHHVSFTFALPAGFEIAKEEGLDVDKHKDILNKILKKLPQDTNWDTRVPREQAFKEAGEVRYYYQKKNPQAYAALIRELGLRR